MPVAFGGNVKFVTLYRCKLISSLLMICKYNEANTATTSFEIGLTCMTFETSTVHDYGVMLM